MAKDLKNLIRLHEWQVDEKRRKVGALLSLVADLELQARRLEEELVTEQAAAAAAPAEAGFFYGRYAETVIERRQRIAYSIAKAEEEITAAQDELREAYRELKKYEIAQENRTKREAYEEARKEQAFLDDIGLQSFRQKRA